MADSLTETDRFRGCLLGLATGDAVGTTVEFQLRGTFTPVTDMVGGGPFRLQPGEWTDDTSMALCLGSSLLHADGFDPDHQMSRYCDWYENGAFSSNGRCFDIGNTVRHALEQYRNTGNPFSGSVDPQSAGNGSIMRLAPVPMFYSSNVNQAIEFASESSRTTHGAAECLDACRFFALVLHRALHGASKEDVVSGCDDHLIASVSIRNISAGAYREKTEQEIQGSGYVVKSLEAALWCFTMTNSFEEAVLTATNLGDDADTTAAICGQVAGAYYGESGIPMRWLSKLVMAADIREMADQLMAAGTSD